jgi:hypothetical protein
MRLFLTGPLQANRPKSTKNCREKEEQQPRRNLPGSLQLHSDVLLLFGDSTIKAKQTLQRIIELIEIESIGREQTRKVMARKGYD